MCLAATRVQWAQVIGVLPASGEFLVVVPHRVHNFGKVGNSAESVVL